jgi:hypothetical protein
MPWLDQNQGNESAPVLDHDAASIGWEAGPMKHDTLYFQHSVVWLVILAGGLAYLWFR